jgi:L-fuconolactonase
MIDHRSAAPDRTGMTIIDAHHHVWSLARGDYGWLTAELAPIHRDFDLADYRAEAPAAIGRSVLVQAAPTLGETRYLLDMARGSGGRVGAVVGWADLDRDDAPRTLADLARDPLLKSVRPMLQDLADAAWILRPRVQQSLIALQALGLRLDALVKPPQLPALLEAIDRLPDLRVVVDHGAKPPIASGTWEPWAGLMRKVAAHPRVHCKLSGLVTEAARNWSIDTLRPYVDHLIEVFGSGRLLWGSDWPVVELNGGIDAWWRATHALLEPLDASARTAILGGNAVRFYGIDRT